MELLDYQNRKIRLTDERLEHILEHPEMATLASELPVVLQNPKMVCQSNTDPTVNLYYRYYEITPVGTKWMCVVVKHLPEDAFVITAYLTDRIKKGTELWPNL